MLDVEIEEGVIITLENNEEYLLVKKIKAGFLAVGIADDIPTDRYYIFKQYEEDGDIYMKIENEFGVA